MFVRVYSKVIMQNENDVCPAVTMFGAVVHAVLCSKMVATVTQHLVPSQGM